MKMTLTTISLLLISFSIYARSLSQSIRDSLLTVTNEIVRTDQLFRNGVLYDSIQQYYKGAQRPTILKVMEDWEQQDKYNFTALAGIIKTYGFPERKLLGEKAPRLDIVLVHWSKKAPEWFNSPELVPYFKRELENGNMPLSRPDMAQMFYMRMGSTPDIRHKNLINNARFAYGLCPYDDGHFLTHVWIDFIKE